MTEQKKWIAPPGWQIVPIEPTEAMLRFAHQQIDWCRDEQNTSVMEDESQTSVYDTKGDLIASDVGTTCKQDLQDAYRAMLAAAPSPQEDAGGDVGKAAIELIDRMLEEAGYAPDSTIRHNLAIVRAFVASQGSDGGKG